MSARLLLPALLFALLGGCVPSQNLRDGGVLYPSEPEDGGVEESEDAGVPSGPRMGANISANGVEFRVWAPNASKAWVETSSGLSPMESEPDGLHRAVVVEARPGLAYRFVFDSPSGRLTRLDPYCRQLAADGKWCTVIDPAAFAWKVQRFERPSLVSSIVYEMHVGSFAVPNGAAFGTLDSARARLPELAELGVNVVQLMPVHAFGGNPNGWGYNPQLFFAPKPSYGTADALRAFVDEAHSHGIAVWLDVVFNHYDGWRAAPLVCYDGLCPNSAWGVHFFPPGEYASTPWGPRPNYTEPHVAEMIKDSVRQWLEEFRGDGFRWDSVSNIRGIDGNGSVPGGKQLLVEANALTRRQGAISTAEDLKGHEPITRDASLGGFGFDSQWDGFGYDVMNVLVPASDDGRDLGAIDRLLRANNPFARVLWTENHDTVGNGGARLPNKVDSANPESPAARRRSMIAAALMLTTPGVPMLFMGQEQLATGGFTDPPKPLAPATTAGAKVRAFYKDLIALRRNLDGSSGALLETGVDILHRNDTNKVIAYRRPGANGQDVVVVLNLRNRAYERYDVGIPTGGAWRVRVDSEWKTYGDDFGGGQTGSVTAIGATKDGRPFTLPVKLGPYGVVVLTR